MLTHPSSYVAKSVLLAALVLLIGARLVHGDTDDGAIPSVVDVNILDSPPAGTPGDGLFIVQIMDSLDTDYVSFLFPASFASDDPADPYGWMAQRHLATDYAVILWSNGEAGRAPWAEVDNQIIDPPAAAEVPEPASLALVGSGLLGLGWLVRGQRRADGPLSG